MVHTNKYIHLCLLTIFGPYLLWPPVIYFFCRSDPRPGRGSIDPRPGRGSAKTKHPSNHQQARGREERKRLWLSGGEGLQGLSVPQPQPQAHARVWVGCGMLRVICKKRNEQKVLLHHEKNKTQYVKYICNDREVGSRRRPQSHG